VLIISHEVVGDRMAGPGFRYYHLARVLAREFPVTLAMPACSSLTNSPDFSTLSYSSGQDPALEQAFHTARAILVPGVRLPAAPALLQTTAPLVIDGYDPYLAETIFLGGNEQVLQALSAQLTKVLTSKAWKYALFLRKIRVKLLPLRR
jgi:hypothetical protein